MYGVIELPDTVMMVSFPKVQPLTLMEASAPWERWEAMRARTER